MSREHPRPGSFKRIASVSNPLIKDIRALAQKKRRDESGLFLVEGQKLVRDGLEDGWPIHTLAYAASAEDQAVGAVAAATKESGGAVLEISGQALKKITRRDNPQNVVGVFRQRFTRSAAIGREGIWVALDRVRDPGNLGTIIRTADAAGVAGVVLIGSSCDPFSLETVRATMGSIFHVPLARIGEEEFVAQVKRHRAELVGTHLTAATVDFRSARYRKPLVLLMGNEQRGLSDPLAAACNALVRIPMRGKADSLNLAVSTGLMIYEALRSELR
jgi:TrmH family RNA methyltransferase